MKKETSDRLWNIAIEKIAYSSYQELFDRNLTSDQFKMDGWIRVKEPAAKIYMGLLARYLAVLDDQHVQPSTDNAENEDIIYRCSTS